MMVMVKMEPKVMMMGTKARGGIKYANDGDSEEEAEGDDDDGGCPRRMDIDHVHISGY